MFAFLTSGYCQQAVAQQELHIHHINVENGDATMIGIWEVAGQKYLSKTLIDGGMSASTTYLLGYTADIDHPFRRNAPGIISQAF